MRIAERAGTRSWTIILIVLLAVSAGVGAITDPGLLGDLTFFARAGDDVLAGRWGQVFDDPAVQAGPVVLVLATALAAAGESAVAVFGLPVIVLAATLGTRLLRAASALERRPALEIAAGVLMLGWESGTGALHTGHLAQLLVPALWVAAATTARRDRTVTAGLLLATATGCETWGVLAVPVLLLVRPASRWRGVGAMLAGSAALYLPFVLTGSFRMLQYRWLVGAGSPFFELAPGLFGDGFPWWARSVQGLLAGLACAVLALRWRGDPVAVWAAPLAAVLVRLTVDPVGLSYYWTAVVVLLIAAVVTAPPPACWVAALLCGWQFVPEARSWSGTGLVTLPGLALVLLLTATSDGGGRPVRRSGPARPAPPRASRPAEPPARSSA